MDDISQNKTKTIKCFEGIRFVIMFCVILCHTAVLKASVPVANVEVLENVFKKIFV